MDQTTPTADRPDANKPSTERPRTDTTDQPGAPAEPVDVATETESGTEVPEPGADTNSRTDPQDALDERLAALEKAADELRESLVQHEHDRRVDRELLIAGARDLDRTRELVGAEVAEGATVIEAISRVRGRRPQLFAPRHPRGFGATALPAPDTPGQPLDRAARDARDSGDRSALLRYLRMRRAGA